MCVDACLFAELLSLLRLGAQGATGAASESAECGGLSSRHATRLPRMPLVQCNSSPERREKKRQMIPEPQAHGFVEAVEHQVKKLDGLWGQLVPMTFLFFMMAFVNTIIDSLKDSLVIQQ
eukprot:jgi/Picre1/28303/NNA_003709.t1